MRRVQVQLTEEQVAHLERRAAASGASIAAVVRAAVEDQRAGDDRRRRIDVARSVLGQFRSGVADVAENHDDYIVDAIEHDLGLR
jgi:hypothetical protein